MPPLTIPIQSNWLTKLESKIKAENLRVLADSVALKLSANFKLEFLPNENEHFKARFLALISKNVMLSTARCVESRKFMFCGRPGGRSGSCEYISSDTLPFVLLSKCISKHTTTNYTGVYLSRVFII